MDLGLQLGRPAGQCSPRDRHPPEPLLAVAPGSEQSGLHLRERIGRSQAATSQLVDALEKRGLVERREDPADGRRSLVHPTRQAMTPGARGLPSPRAVRVLPTSR
ncbi:MarR family winged helix-turn-helix transcriptional regulator [Archangium violaceum]|uniref:MarR family winged helix-turn-helix transcriptional regulator n=1 Tax=Archangium violaceum TaxID=83451 RepID=UPI0035E3BD7A